MIAKPDLITRHSATALTTKALEMIGMVLRVLLCSDRGTDIHVESETELVLVRLI